MEYVTSIIFKRDLLSNRLLLIRHHLMYERCGRLLHAERNRRLFGFLNFFFIPIIILLHSTRI